MQFLRVESRLQQLTMETTSAPDSTSMLCSVECCTQFQTDICDDATDWTNSLPFSMQMLLITVLLSLSALFAGLTLGFLSLDMTQLEIVVEGDDPKRAESARQVLTVRKNGNLLLCTLICGNVMVNSFLSILMGHFFGGMVGLITSTASIVVFAEILPQAICARYALEIGSASVPLVRVIIFLFYPVAYPLAFCLNRLLGNELPTTYSSAEMHKLLQIHVDEGRFDAETADAMTGALTYKNTTVQEVMTSIENTFMVNVDEKLSFQTIATIFKNGYSRIPVYELSRNNIIGLLFVKDLIFIDPEDEIPVRSFVQIFGRAIHFVRTDDKLGDILRELKKGKTHMALVRDKSKGETKLDSLAEIKGIITIEDIIEEIIGDEIVDETDTFVDGTHRVKVKRRENFDWSKLALLDSKIVTERLPLEKVIAVTAHLRTNYSDSFVSLTDLQLQRLVAETGVDELPEPKHEVGRQVPDDLLYSRGVETDFCTFILSGKLAVIAGADEFRSEVSSWSALATRVFQEDSYSPDFTAFVTGGTCRCLRISKAKFKEAMDASKIEESSNVLSEQSNQLNSLNRQTRRAQLLHAFRSKSDLFEGMSETSGRGDKPQSPEAASTVSRGIDTRTSDATFTGSEASSKPSACDSLLRDGDTTSTYGAT